MLPSCRLPAQRCPRVMGESWMVCPSVFSSAADHIGWARWAHLQPVRSQVQLWHLWDSFGFEWGGRSTGNQNWEVEDMTYVTYMYLCTNGVGVSSRISGRSTPLRRTDFLARKFFDFDERLLLSTPSFSTEQLLETSESGDPDFLGSLSAQNPGA